MPKTSGANIPSNKCKLLKNKTNNYFAPGTKCQECGAKHWECGVKIFLGFFQWHFDVTK